MERIVKQGLLYDFYGELLTPHQKSIYEDAVLNDMSLSEIAEEYEITRQGVHDLLKRCNKQFEEYESKLHLVEKFIKIRLNAERIQQLSSCLYGKEDSSQQKALKEICDMANGIIEEL